MTSDAAAEAGDSLDLADMADLVAGDDLALNRLMDRHAERIYHYLIRVLRDDHDAQDLTQETFVRVYQHRRRFNPKFRFSSWLYSIATNLARDTIRWRQRHPKVSLEALDESGDGTVRHNERFATREAVVSREESQVIEDAVARLPEDLKIPLVLSVYEGLSHQDIGALISASSKAVEMKIYRARKALKDELNLVLS